VTSIPDLGSLSDADLKRLIDDLEREETEVSFERRKLHGRIEILRNEVPDLAALSNEDIAKSLANVLTARGGAQRELSEETRRELQQLEEQEREISSRRRLLHRRIDLLRAELVARLQRSRGETVLSQVDLDKLTEILTPKSSPPVTDEDERG
jgi:hypothetical protein